MCDPEKLLERLDNLLLCLRNQNSGADIHDVANMRSQCQMLIKMIKDKDLTPAEAHKICMSIENAVVEFFMKKYTS